MQDQLTGGQSNLQQPKSDLQQNTPNLQQSGTGTTTDNVSGLLSESAPSGVLRVSTANSSESTIKPDAAVYHANHAAWLLPLGILLLVIASYMAFVLWPRRVQEQLPEALDQPVEPAPAVTPKPTKPKTKKKSQKRKKSGRR